MKQTNGIWSKSQKKQVRAVWPYEVIFYDMRLDGPLMHNAAVGLKNKYGVEKKIVFNTVDLESIIEPLKELMTKESEAVVNQKWQLHLSEENVIITFPRRDIYDLSLEHFNELTDTYLENIRLKVKENTKKVEDKLNEDI